MRLKNSVFIGAAVLSSLVLISSFSGAVGVQNVFHSIFLLDDSGDYHTEVTASNSQSTDLNITLPNSAGSNGQILQTDGSGNLSWASAISNPMTTSGDIIRGGSSGAPARLGVGTSGQVLSVVSGAPDWRTGLVGTTTNDNAASGYVGEFIGDTETSDTTGSTTIDTYSDINSLSITLTAGDWDIQYGANFLMGGLGGTGSMGAFLALRDSSDNMLRSHWVGSATVSSNPVAFGSNGYFRASISSSTTYKLSFALTSANGSPTATTFRTDLNSGRPAYIEARRVR